MKHGSTWVALGFAAFVLAGCEGKPPTVKANWVPTAQDAVNYAQQQNKPMLIAFTGSDWSPASQSMQKDVLDSPQFKEFADQYLILYQADFPRYKTLPASQAEQNAQWAKQSVIDAYPTYVVLTVKNGQLSYLGRMVGTTQGEQFLAQLRQMLGIPDPTLPAPPGTP